MQEENETNYLEDILEKKFIRASAGKRFANFIIDYVVLIITFFIFSLIAFYCGFYQDISPLFNNILFNWLIYVLVMFIMETFMKGKSIGKLITKTTAINKTDKSPITTRTAFLRSLCRIIPFEPLSALSNNCYPWHDKWTGTVVVED